VDGLKPVYLITGTDFPKIALALRRLRARFEQGSVELLDAETCTGSEAVAATNALGLFGGGERLVVVRGIERWKQADADEIIHSLESPTPGAVLALAGDPAKLAGLVDICARVGDVLRYDVRTRKRRGRDEQDYAAWVQDLLERLGVRADSDAAGRIVELVGQDTFALQGEVEKIASWASDEPVSVSDVEALVAPGSESQGSAVAFAWGSRDVATALGACENELRGAPEPFWLASRLATHVTRTRAVQRGLESGAGLGEIGKTLGLRFPPRREAAAAERFTPDELERAIVRLAELDLSIKGGSRLDPALELERALVDVIESLERH
jgi:DNA polymerase-3 subunit delta